MPSTLARPLAAFALVVALGALPALAEEVIAATADDRLITFDTSTPQALDSDVAITGLGGHVLAMDVRPLEGALYALTDQGRLFRVDRASGAAIAVGTGPVASVPSSGVGMNFDPATDRIRVVTAAGANFQINPADGTVENDTSLAYVVGDPSFPQAPHVVAVAFTSDFPSGKTTSFVLDTGLDVTARLGDADGSEASRDAGQLHTLGVLGVNSTDFAGFDISRDTGRAYAALTLAGEGSSRLYAISLFTGAASPIGLVADGTPIRAIAIGPASNASPAASLDLIGLTSGGDLVQFASDAPTTIEHRVPVTGLVGGDTLVSIALRPSNRKLYGLGSGGRIYVVNAVSGQATPIRQQPFDVALQGSRVSMDFNPQSDVIRVVSSSGQNFRVQPDTGAVIDGDSNTAGVQGDANLAYPSDDRFFTPNPHVVAIAYDRNGIETAPTLFAIDAGTDALVRVGSKNGVAQSPNTGQLHSIGALGVDTADLVGFEIAGDADAFATLTSSVSGPSRLFAVDLSTGRATLVGDVGTGETLLSVAVAPSANPPAPGADLRIAEMIVRLDFRRTGDDFVQIFGTLPFPAAGRGGRSVTVNVGGFTKSFTLNARGSGRADEGTRSGSDDDFFQLVGRPSDGRIHFLAVLRRDEIASSLVDEGLTNDDVRRADRTVNVTITVDGTAYSSDVTLRYTAHAGRQGIGHKP